MRKTICTELHTLTLYSILHKLQSGIKVLQFSPLFERFSVIVTLIIICSYVVPEIAYFIGIYGSIQPLRIWQMILSGA